MGSLYIYYEYSFALEKNRTFVTGSSIKRITTMLPRLPLSHITVIGDV